jgi:hypothetical protein
MRRLIPLVLTAILLLAACGGKDKKDVAANDTGTTSTSEVTTSTALGGAEAGTATTVAGKTATTKKPGTSGGGATGGGGGGSASPTGGAAAIKPATPGSYTYKTTGNSSFGPVNETSTLKVDPPSGSDQHSAQTGQQGGTETVLRYQADGVYLVSLKLSGQITKEFRLNPPGLALPQPATVGRTWSWTATSTDGKTSVKSDFKVLRTETIAVGGEQVPTVVLETVVTTSGDLVSTSKGTRWVSEAYRLTVREDSQMQGTYSGFSFNSTTSSLLQSTKPS